MAVSAAAVQVPTASAIAVYTPSGNKVAQTVVIQNLGPNAIYIGGSTVTTATGVAVAATSGVITLHNVDDVVYARAATALQSTPADTRVIAFV